MAGRETADDSTFAAAAPESDSDPVVQTRRRKRLQSFHSEEEVVSETKQTDVANASHRRASGEDMSEEEEDDDDASDGLLEAGDAPRSLTSKGKDKGKRGTTGTKAPQRGTRVRSKEKKSFADSPVSATQATVYRVLSPDDDKSFVMSKLPASHSFSDMDALLRTYRSTIAIPSSRGRRIREFLGPLLTLSFNDNASEKMQIGKMRHCLDTIPTLSNPNAEREVYWADSGWSSDLVRYWKSLQPVERLVQTGTGATLLWRDAEQSILTILIIADWEDEGASRQSVIFDSLLCAEGHSKTLLLLVMDGDVILYSVKDIETSLEKVPMLETNYRSEMERKHGRRPIFSASNNGLVAPPGYILLRLVVFPSEPQSAEWLARGSLRQRSQSLEDCLQDKLFEMSLSHDTGENAAGTEEGGSLMSTWGLTYDRNLPGS